MDIYLGLFLSAFLSSTLLPGSSEILLIGLFAEGYDAYKLWAWATVGNTLGSLLNWLLGAYLLHYQDRSWFPFKAGNLKRSQQWFQKYGKWSLLLAWAPVVGDALTFIAGMMKVNLGIFTALVFIGKGLRYAAILGFIDWITALNI
jgi:membrane protein YqaA with SNARE-associated domain